MVLQLAIIALAVAAGWFVRSFFPAYLSEKGKNLATKEDIAEITNKVEQVPGESQAAS
ncbi:MAG TPA: hypothetical protein VEU08_12305 [Vicinamibacterales bacterium]|nr:hypothetical protein [Vicinamibacterales bacterium]